MEFVTDPVEWWIEPFTTGGSATIMRNALWAGLLVVLATSVVGTWVVLRGMSFLGDALSHGVLPGIAFAFILGFDTTLGALAAALLMAGGVNLIRGHSPLPEDTSIGILFVGFLALAVVTLSAHTGSYVGDLNTFLFGSVLGIDNADLVRQAITAGIAVAGALVFHRALLVMTFDESQAALLGLRPRLAHAALLGLLAVAIVSSFEVVGNLLVFAFLIAPPATATLLVRRVPRIMVAAVIIGAAAVVLGLLISYHAEAAPGATMALTAVTFFLLALVERSLRATIRTRYLGPVRSAL